MKRPLVFLTTVLSISIFSTQARADVITEWNSYALQAIRDEGSNMDPPWATRTLAMAHLAAFDAANSVTPTYQPYMQQFATNGPSSGELAASQAMHDVLSYVFSGNPQTVARLDSLLTSHRNAVADPSVRANSINLGSQVATQMITLRSGDGWNAASTYNQQPATAPGAWQAGITAGAWGSVSGKFIRSEWGYVAPFMNAPSASSPAVAISTFRPAAPPALNSKAYADAYSEVKMFGAAAGSSRDQDQTDVARFWQDGPGTSSPPGHWNAIASSLVKADGSAFLENARLFALMNVASADSAIAAWDTKREYDFWRPFTAVPQTSADDGNPDTVADPAWTPFLPTPSFPSYVSGHSTFSSASATILADWLGTDQIHIDVLSESADLPSGYTRSFEFLSDAAAEAGQSRIYGGIHFQFDNQVGLTLGRNIGNHVYGSLLQPIAVPEPDALALGLSAFAFIMRRRQRRAA